MGSKQLPVLKRLLVDSEYRVQRIVFLKQPFCVIFHRFKNTTPNVWGGMYVHVRMSRNDATKLLENGFALYRRTE